MKKVIGLILIAVFLYNLIKIIEYQKIPYNKNLYTGYEGYRLGDMFYHRFGNNHDKYTDYHLKTYPNSIAVKYYNRTKYPEDYFILKSILDDYSIDNDMISSNTLVLHLRVGDVCENIVSRYRFKNHTKSLDDIKQTLSMIPDNIDNVIIVAGSHIKYYAYINSILYIEQVRKYIVSQGYNVVLRLGNNPDDDFVFMCNSHHFIPAGGGYSDIIKNIVKIKGGDVYE